MIKNLKQKASNAYTKVGVAVGMTAVGMGAANAAPVDVTEVVSEISETKAPIAAVAGASLGAYVAIRVWKLVRRAI